MPILFQFLIGRLGTEEDWKLSSTGKTVSIPHR